MCGIAALFAYAATTLPIDSARLLAMREAMVARGPDGAGLWQSEDGRVGLAHRRLSIIDPGSGGAQPMATDDGRLVISFNGEIYNYRALREELEQRGFRLRSHSDTEVLLHLYRCYGPSFVERLRGMYAFALWDAEKRGLLLARDPYGIKPLYIQDDGTCLAVASQVKALLAGGGKERPPFDPAGLAGFYLLGHVPEPFTCYQGIESLAAGAVEWWDEGGRRRLTVRGAETLLAEALAQAEETVSSPAKTGDDRFADAIRESVAHHLVADVPVGVFLSAGLDSGTLAALARQTLPATAPPLRTLTLAFAELEGTPADEAPLAAEVAAALGSLHSTRRVARDAFLAEFPALMAAMDQPSTDGVNTYFISKAATETGLKVAMSGLGGDELLGGYPSFRQIPRLVRNVAPLASIPGLGRALRWASAAWIGRWTSPKYAGLVEYGGRWSGAWLLRRALYMPWELPAVMGMEAARNGLARLDPIGNLESSLAVLPRCSSSLLKVLLLESLHYMRDRLLRDADWAGMAHSLEIRVPLVDRGVLTELAPLWADRQSPGKADLACLAGDVLPEAVRERSKTGFTVPVRDWLLENPNLPPAFRQARGLRGWAGVVAQESLGYLNLPHSH